MFDFERRFVIRTTLCPFELSSESSAGALKKLFSRPVLQEAIYIASRSLYHSLQQFLADELPEEETRRVAQSLNKYLIRLSARPTPFGLFAGVGLGTWSKSSKDKLPGLISRRTRLDSAFTSKLVAHLLENNQDLSQSTRYFPNNTLYQVGDKLRYIDILNEGRSEFFLADVESSDHVSRALGAAASGMNKMSLAELLTEEDISIDEATDFVQSLIDNRLLMSELEMRFTGKDYFSYVLGIVRGHNITIPLLHEVQSALGQLDMQSSEENLNTLSSLISKLHKTVGVQEADTLIQTDMFVGDGVEINEKVLSTIEKTVSILAGLPLPSMSLTFEEFKQRFVEKYELRTVDLCVALDPETGIGYPFNMHGDVAESDLLRSIEYSTEEEKIVGEVTDFQRFLIRKYSDAIRYRQHIELTEQELRPFSQPAVLPRSMHAFVSLGAGSAEAIDNGDYVVQFNGAYGPSAASLLARFCHLDNTVHDLVSDVIKREEEGSDTLFAEIVHANQPRIANISTRPVLRSYEIPIFTIGGVDMDHTIPISDLTLNLVGNRLVLRSRKLNKEVVPRLSSAHNFTSDTISVYRFLCDYQFQGIRGSVRWSWGILDAAQYLPRVTLGKSIVSPARWSLSKEELSSLKDTNTLRNSIRALQARLSMPDIVVVGESDNKLPINLQNEDHLPIFQKLVQSNGIVEEFVMTDKLWLSDAHGRRYLNEIVIPFFNLAGASVKTDATGPNFSGAREFGLQSEWIYFKLYCNFKAANGILIGAVEPLRRSLLDDHVIDSWFFVRYADPLPHIRIRFHGSGTFYNEVTNRLQQLAAPLIENGMLSSIMTDTYKREVERYGGENIIAVEDFFFADSEAVMEFFTYMANGGTMSAWEAALAFADQLMSCSLLRTEERMQIMSDLRDAFFAEMKVNKEMKLSMDLARRKNRKSIESILHGTDLDDDVRSILNKRAARLEEIFIVVKDNISTGKSTATIQDIVKSCLHMTFNRLFETNARHHEMVLYDFLFSYYASMLARNQVK